MTTLKEKAALLREIADNPMLQEVGRLAVEDVLVDWRDDMISQLGRNNGYTIKGRDGTPSSVIRFGPEFGWRIAARAIADKLEGML